jgi:serine protease
MTHGYASRCSLLVLCASLALTACFDTDRPPTPDTGPRGSISGRILVDTASGLSTGSAAPDRGDAAVRAALDAARTDRVPATIDDANQSALALTEQILRRRKDLAPVFHAGDAVVVFARGAYDRHSLPRALEGMRRRAAGDGFLFKVGFTVNWCALRMFCLVKLTDDDGFLDDGRTADVVAALHKVRPDDIHQVMRNDVYQGFRTPNDELFPQQWNYQAINLPAAWELSVGDPDLVVAVVDSGVVHDNPDLRDKLTREPNNPERFVEADFVDASVSLDGDGPDLDAEDPGDNLFGPAAGQDSFHGTHTAGIVGAVTNNRRGVAGVMWEAQILPVRVLGDRLQGTVADILAGVVWAVGGEIDLFPPNQRPARIVNLSLGGTATPSAQELWEGVLSVLLDDPEDEFDDPIFIAAAGNSGIDAQVVVPANIPRMITVGASRLDGLRAVYSNFGPAIDVIAPGGEVNQDQDQNEVPDGIVSTLGLDVGNEQGTSMAAPHITGLAGLLVAQKAELNHDAVHNLIRDTATIRFRCNEGCGQGLADAAAALLQSGVEIQPTPRLALTAQTVIFNGGITQRAIRILNLGSVAAPFSVSVTRGQAERFAVSPASGTVPPAGGVDLTITLSRAGTTTGSTALVVTGSGEATGQQLTASLAYNDNPARDRRDVDEVEVGAFVRDEAGALVQVARTLAVREDNFAWTIEGLAVGAYELYATGDDNFDGTFDSLRESVGAYPTTTGVEAVAVVDENVPVVGVDFAIRVRTIEIATDGLGAACSEATKNVDCAGVLEFAADVGCIESFPGGYCSRFCTDEQCGSGGRCDTLDCDGAPCQVCLQRCVADAQCREGYLCILDTCVPPGFDVPG